MGLQHDVVQDGADRYPLSDLPRHPHLRCLVERHSVRVVAWQWDWNRFDINAFADERRSSFDAISVLPARKALGRSQARSLAKYRKPGDIQYDEGRLVDDTRCVTLWFTNRGWADTDADWHKVLARCRAYWTLGQPSDGCGESVGRSPGRQRPDRWSPMRLDGTAPKAPLDIRAVTVVLLSGRMTLSDGSTIDSRQPVDGPATQRAVSQALTSSPEWWAAVSSLVLPTLDEPPHGFALVLAARTTARGTADGDVQRSSLRRVLRGGIGTLSIQRSGMNATLSPEYSLVATLRNWQTTTWVRSACEWTATLPLAFP